MLVCQLSLGGKGPTKLTNERTNFFANVLNKEEEVFEKDSPFEILFGCYNHVSTASVEIQGLLQINKIRNTLILHNSNKQHRQKSLILMQIHKIVDEEKGHLFLSIRVTFLDESPSNLM